MYNDGDRVVLLDIYADNGRGRSVIDTSVAFTWYERGMVGTVKRQLVGASKLPYVVTFDRLDNGRQRVLSCGDREIELLNKEPDWEL